MKRIYWIICILIFIAVVVAGANAACVDTPEIPSDRITKIRSLLLGDNTNADFHLYAEAMGTESHAKFLLYSVAKNVDTTPDLYLAGLSNGEDEKLLFTHNLSYYVPRISNAPAVVASRPASQAKSTAAAEPGPLTFDGCLNAFTINPKREGIHVNIFARSASLKTEGASDVILVLLGNNFIEPVLELWGTSGRKLSAHNSGHTDSLIAIAPSASGATEVIWQEFSRHAIQSTISGSVSENMLYHWEDKGFKRVGTLSPPELSEHLKTAVELPRCSAITKLRFEYKMPGPNQPAP